MKLKPLQDRVIVKQSETEEKTKSGILLPDTAKEKPTKGKVIAVGPGKLDEKNGKPMELGVRVGAEGEEVHQRPRVDRPASLSYNGPDEWTQRRPGADLREQRR